MEVDVAKGHEDECGFIEYIVAPLSQLGVSEIAVIEYIHLYLVVAEHMYAEFLQLEVVFLRKHWIREYEVIPWLNIMSICHIRGFCSRTTFKRCAISRMKANCSLAFRDTAGDPSPRHKI
jgi:hypothetical protein